MKTKPIFCILAASLLSAGTLLAQPPEPSAAEEGYDIPSKMAGHMDRMKEWHEKMSKEIKAQDAELDKLVQEIDSSKGEKKLDAMANALKKLIQQRRSMHERMENFRLRFKGGKEEAPESSSSPEAESR